MYRRASQYQYQCKRSIKRPPGLLLQAGGSGGGQGSVFNSSVGGDGGNDIGMEQAAAFRRGDAASRATAGDGDEDTRNRPRDKAVKARGGRQTSGKGKSGAAGRAARRGLAEGYSGAGGPGDDDSGAGTNSERGSGAPTARGEEVDAGDVGPAASNRSATEPGEGGNDCSGSSSSNGEAGEGGPGPAGSGQAGHQARGCSAAGPGRVSDDNDGQLSVNNGVVGYMQGANRAQDNNSKHQSWRKRIPAFLSYNTVYRRNVERVAVALQRGQARLYHRFLESLKRGPGTAG